ncbi:hypothetical protein NKH71_32905 [Mesorhizobium sp. M0983]|uniref:hypothetical protein n=1 Tax=Mesorhizobium sp. M0983 TaxID=2957040 RepID=UPI00333CD7B1
MLARHGAQPAIALEESHTEARSSSKGKRRARRAGSAWENGEALAELKFGGDTFGKGDILKIMGNEGAAQAVPALLEKAEALAKLEFRRRTEAQQR